MTTGRGLGLRRATRRRATVGAHLLDPIGRAYGDVVSLPKSFSLGQYEPECEDQGPTETCYAHAASAAIATAFAAAGMPLGWVPSPLDLSRIVRSLARALTTLPGGPMPKLVDNGADDVTTFTALADFGVNPMGLTVEGRFSDARNENVNGEPDFQALEASAQKLIVGPYAIDQSDPTRTIDMIRASIFTGFPVWTSAFCASPEFDWKPGDSPIGVPDETDPRGGGHATFFDGWDTYSGGIILSKRGSWGSGYGLNGNCLVASAWALSAWNLWPIVVSRAS